MFDVTFHPASEYELKKFIFAPLHDATLSTAALADAVHGLSADNKAHLQKALELLPKYLEQARTAGNLDRFSWACAIIVGQIHPYWFGKNTPYAFLPNYQSVYDQYVVSPASMDAALFNGVTEQWPAALTRNQSAGGYIPASQVQNFFNQLIKDALQDDTVLIDYAGLLFALRYAQDNGCGVLEATDVYDTWKGCYTNTQHLKTVVTRNTFPYIYLSFPAETKDLITPAKDFAKAGPDPYIQFLKQQLSLI